MVSTSPRATPTVMGGHSLYARQPSHENQLNPETLGAVIRQRRKELGMTQEELGDQSGINQSQVSHLERGSIRMPSLELLRRLADALNLPAGYLLELAHFPGAFRRGWPDYIAEGVERLPESEKEAFFAYLHYLLKGGDELSEREWTLAMTYMDHIKQRSRED